MSIKPFIAQIGISYGKTEVVEFYSLSAFTRWCSIRKEDYLSHPKMNGRLPFTSELGLRRLGQLAELAKKHFDGLNENSID